MLNRVPAAVALIGIGWYFAGSIVIGIVGGLLLDSWLNTKPLFTLIGLFVGLAAAGWGGYKLLMQVLSMSKSEEGQER